MRLIQPLFAGLCGLALIGCPSTTSSDTGSGNGDPADTDTDTDADTDTDSDMDADTDTDTDADADDDTGYFYMFFEHAWEIEEGTTATEGSASGMGQLVSYGGVNWDPLCVWTYDVVSTAENTDEGCENCRFAFDLNYTHTGDSGSYCDTVGFAYYYGPDYASGEMFNDSAWTYGYEEGVWRNYWKVNYGEAYGTGTLWYYSSYYGTWDYGYAAITYFYETETFAGTFDWFEQWGWGYYYP